jgi:hypothetical protein
MYLLNTSLRRIHVQVPVNDTILSVSLFQPLVRFLEVSAVELQMVISLPIVVIKKYESTHPSPRRAQRTRMNTLEN